MVYQNATETSSADCSIDGKASFPTLSPKLLHCRKKVLWLDRGECLVRLIGVQLADVQLKERILKGTGVDHLLLFAPGQYARVNREELRGEPLGDAFQQVDLGVVQSVDGPVADDHLVEPMPHFVNKHDRAEDDRIHVQPKGAQFDSESREQNDSILHKIVKSEQLLLVVMNSGFDFIDQIRRETFVLKNAIERFVEKPDIAIWFGVLQASENALPDTCVNLFKEPKRRLPVVFEDAEVVPLDRLPKVWVATGEGAVVVECPARRNQAREGVHAEPIISRKPISLFVRISDTFCVHKG